MDTPRHVPPQAPPALFAKFDDLNARFRSRPMNAIVRLKMRQDFRALALEAKRGGVEEQEFLTAFVKWQALRRAAQP